MIGKVIGGPTSYEILYYAEDILLAKDSPAIGDAVDHVCKLRYLLSQKWVGGTAGYTAGFVGRGADIRSMTHGQAHTAYLLAGSVYATAELCSVQANVTGYLDAGECDEGLICRSHHAGVTDGREPLSSAIFLVASSQWCSVQCLALPLARVVRCSYVGLDGVLFEAQTYRLNFLKFGREVLIRCANHRKVLVSADSDNELIISSIKPSCYTDGLGNRRLRPRTEVQIISRSVHYLVVVKWQWREMRIRLAGYRGR
ncbi:hypothetical protein HPB49_004085 [Dermacentor silvarum]|uniref:Uncharacterized protein n=1 Tax=Dermacentor silvarum TaxID=543639 RepID=A0ACB8D2R3_DERSI|nr:hypothetical protein HPB49_004085 [Dermacentor silvarum]